MTVTQHLTLAGLQTQLIETSGPSTAPLLVAMHGIGSNEHDLAGAYARFAPRAQLAFPRSPLEHPPGYAWYRLVRVGVPDPQSLEMGLERLGEYLAALRALPGNAARPLILSGFSQGAIMSLSYALRHPEQVSGVMAFSGYIPQPVIDALPAGEAPAAGPAVFLTLGRRDQLFPFSRLDEAAQVLAARGIQPTVFAHDSGHDIPASAMAAAASWLSQAFPS